MRHSACMRRVRRLGGRPVLVLSVVFVVGFAAEEDAGRSAAGSAVRSGCVRETPLSPFEASIRQAQAVRRDFRLRADRPYVVSLQRDPAARRRRTAENGDIPLTADEAAYFSDRYRVEEEAGAVGRYVGRIAGLSGGVSIEDDGRRGAYVGLRVTRRLRQAERAQVARRARRFRIRRVRFSERHLRQIQEQVGDIAFAEGSAIDAQELSVDIDRNAVVLVHTSSRDATRALEKRFGASLAVVRRPATRPACVAPARYTVSKDGLVVTLFWSVDPGGLVGAPRAVARELEDRVLLSGVDDHTTGAITLVDRPDVIRRASVRLTQPLGDRRVLAIKTGRAIRRTS